MYMRTKTIIPKLSAVAADIDGTLMPKGEKIMPITRQAIQKLHQEGIWFGLATGRAISTGMFQRAKDWNPGFEFDFLIGINDGQLWDRNHTAVINTWRSRENVCTP